MCPRPATGAGELTKRKKRTVKMTTTPKRKLETKLKRRLTALKGLITRKTNEHVGLVEQIQKAEKGLEDRVAYLESYTKERCRSVLDDAMQEHEYCKWALDEAERACHSCEHYCGELVKIGQRFDSIRTKIQQAIDTRKPYEPN